MQMLTEEEVANLLHCSRACLRRMRREGRGPHFLHIGRLVRYPPESVEEYVDAQYLAEQRIRDRRAAGGFR